MGPFSKLRREIEPRWVSQYVAETWPDAQVRMRCPLGPIPKDVEQAYGLERGLRIFRPWRPEVDALVVLPDRLVLVEGKVFRPMDGIAKLPVYKGLVPDTPELKPLLPRPVDMQLLVVRPLPWVKAAADRAGITLVDYAPDWVVRVWEERDRYWTREALERREARKRRLREIGFE